MGLLVSTAAEGRLKAVASLLFRALCSCDAVGAAAELIGVAGATLEVGSQGDCVFVWAASMLRVLAAAALIAGSLCDGDVVGAAPVTGVLASTTLKMGSFSRLAVVWTASEGV